MRALGCAGVGRQSINARILRAPAHFFLLPPLFSPRTGPVADCFVLVDWSSPALTWSDSNKQSNSLPVTSSPREDVELVSVRVASDSLPSPVIMSHARAPTPRALTPEPHVDVDSVRQNSLFLCTEPSS